MRTLGFFKVSDSYYDLAVNIRPMLKLHMENYARGKSQHRSESVHWMFNSVIDWLNPGMHPPFVILGHDVAGLLECSVAIL